MDPRVTDNRIRLVRNDTGPQIRFSLTDESTGDPLNLTNSTATLHMKSATTGAVVLSRSLTIPVSTAAQGIAIAVWEAGDLNLTPGDYDGEVEVVLTTGIRQTVYDILKFRIREQIA